MKRVLFITMHRPRRSPGQRFRFEQYIPYLEQNGYICDVSAIISEFEDKIIYAPGNYSGKLLVFARSALTRIRDVIHAGRYDIVFIFREALMVNSAVIEALLARSTARLIFDFDDAVWLQDVSDANRRLAWLRGGPSKIPAILRGVDSVFAGNAYLADYARRFNGNVHIVPTTIDTDTHAPRTRAARSRVCVGWSGSPSTTAYFDALAPALGRVKQMFGDEVYFKMIGNAAYRRPDLGIIGTAWREDTEVEDTAELDIGVMPLPDDAWSRGKCGFKALLYMALAIPPVVSPVGVNTDIVQDGVNGLLAADESAWVDALARLIADPELRAELGRRGRETVVERYSVRSQRDRYVALFDELSAMGPRKS